VLVICFFDSIFLSWKKLTEFVASPLLSRRWTSYSDMEQYGCSNAYANAIGKEPHLFRAWKIVLGLERRNFCLKRVFFWSSPHMDVIRATNREQRVNRIRRGYDLKRSRAILEFLYAIISC
jgi:hypothetical protein